MVLTKIWKIEYGTSPPKVIWEECVATPHSRECSSTFRPVFRGRLRGLTQLPPPEKSTQKFLVLSFCCTVEHVQLKNVTADVMDIIVTITFGVKCAPECINMHHFEG